MKLFDIRFLLLFVKYEMYAILFETARFHIVNRHGPTFTIRLLCMQETIKRQDKTLHPSILESLVNTTGTYTGQKQSNMHEMQNTSQIKGTVCA